VFHKYAAPNILHIWQANFKIFCQAVCR